MPRLLHPKHEAFAQAVAAGVGLSDAYEQVGFVRRRGDPNRLARRPKVAARIAELQSHVFPTDLTNLEYIQAKARDIATQVPDAAGNRDLASRLADDFRRIARALEQKAGIDGEREASPTLSPDQIATVNDTLGKLPRPSREARAYQTPNLTEGDPEGSAETPSAQPAAPPFAPQGTPQQGARPGVQSPQMSPPGAGVARVAQAHPNNAINPKTLRQLGVPDQYLDRPQMWVDGQLKRADALSRRAELKEVVGIPAKASLDQADQIRTRMKQIQGFIGDAGKNTSEQTNARDLAVSQSEGLKVAQKHEIDQGAALQNGLQTSARDYDRDLKPNLDAMRGIMNNPHFVTGTGVGLQEAPCWWPLTAGAHAQTRPPITGTRSKCGRLRR